MNYERDIFKPYLELRFKQANAITYGEKLELVELLIEETKSGKLPIQDGQVIRLNPNSTAVTAVREGKTVSIDKSIQKTERATAAQKGKARKNALMAVSLLLILPLLFTAWWFTRSGAEQEMVGTPTAVAETAPTATNAVPVFVEITDETPTSLPTMTPEPTFTPVPVEPEEYEVELDDETTLADQTNPIAIRFLGEEYQVSLAARSATWRPEGVEWWQGTHVRRVFAMPYQAQLLTDIFSSIGEPITIRLRTGVAIQYRLENVERVHEAQIEMLTAQSPSIAIVLYGEGEADGRWLITGDAIQEAAVAAPETEPITTAPIPFVTINQCQTESIYRVSCVLSVPIDTDVQKLHITDMGWLDGLDHLPKTDRTTIEESELLIVQFAGVVRSPKTAVLVYRDSTGDQIQQLDSYLHPENQPEETDQKGDT